MANLRIIYDNAAKRSTLTADSTIGNFVATNLLTDIKGEVWRGDSSAARSLTLTWASAETISAVVLPFCSLSSTATIRVRCFSDVACTAQTYATGWVIAAPASPLGASGWAGVGYGVNSYAFGGAATAVVYFPAQTGVRGLKVDIQDTTNPLGYLEAGAIVVGDYFSPLYNVQAGEVSVETTDSSKHERSDAGDLFTDRGTLSKSLNLTLQHMPAADRNAVWRVLRGNAMMKPVFVSVNPEGGDSVEEQMYSIYGRLSSTSAMQYQFMGQFQASLKIDEL